MLECISVYVGCRTINCTATKVIKHKRLFGAVVLSSRLFLAVRLSVMVGESSPHPPGIACNQFYLPLQFEENSRYFLKVYFIVNEVFTIFYLSGWPQI